jgi:hypothetical protein
MMAKMDSSNPLQDIYTRIRKQATETEVLVAGDVIEGSLTQNINPMFMDVQII